MRGKRIRPIIAMLALSLSASAFAGISYIEQGLMDWNRGDAGSTWQEWTFDDADNPAAPEASQNPGAPLATLTGSSGSAAFQWNATKWGRTGVWSGDPVVVSLFIPNYETANPVKTIWFEMDYRCVTMQPPSVVVEDNYGVEQVYCDYGIRYDNAGNVIDDWRTMVIGWQVTPNPAFETIQFALAGTGGFVDRVSVDTMCTVPEPCTLLITGVGLLGVRCFRKRNQAAVAKN